MRTRLEKEEYECTRTEFETKCEPLEESREGLCFREVEGLEEYDCSYDDFEEECREEQQEVATLCFREGEVEEKYECTKTVTEQACRKAPVQIEYPCHQTVTRKRCGTVHQHNYIHPVAVNDSKKKSGHGGGHSSSHHSSGHMKLRRLAGNQGCVDVPETVQTTCTRVTTGGHRRGVHLLCVYEICCYRMFVCFVCIFSSWRIKMSVRT
eukprot:GHVS01063390.1.p1 GENE.GHVS01063390.1~~GHVS01063390.1.p1  ORF type:complete len:209 (-),score=23.79 GHVS01063390.1:2-628(-)